MLLTSYCSGQISENSLIVRRLGGRPVVGLLHCAVTTLTKPENNVRQLTLSGVGVEKLASKNGFSAVRLLSSVLPAVQLNSSQDWPHRLSAEEAYQSLDVLNRCGQEELLPHELQPPQA